MTEDPNPYSPPAVLETAAPSACYWYLEGTRLHARHGAALPKVDLQTGRQVPEMTAQPVVARAAGSFDVAGSLLILAVYFAAKTWLDLGPAAFPALIVAIIVLRRIGALGGGPRNQVVVWTFAEAGRARNAKRRRRLRLAVLWLVFGGMLLLILSPATGSSFLFDSLVIETAIALIFAMLIWGIFDRPKFRTRPAGPGWMQIAPIHPAALELLQAEQLENERRKPADARRRLVQTCFLHRYPLRLLTGGTQVNPLVWLRIALMKLLRSRLLVRESYHFSEAEERTPEQLAAPLQTAITDWLAAHPDWRVVSCEHLPSPAGDLVVEHAILASADLTHVLSIGRAWMEQTPDRGRNQHSFGTWLRDGTLVRTHDHPFLELPLPGVTDHTHRGKPAEVLAQHLAHLAGRLPDPAQDAAALRERVLWEKRETARLLVAGGYLSEPREAA